MEEIRARMSAIEDPRHQSYIKYALADIVIIIMCAVLSGLDTLGDLVIYAKNKEEFFRKELGIKKVPSKGAFARILSMIDGKQIGEAILDVLHSRFGTVGEVVAVDGKAICSTAKAGNPHMRTNRTWFVFDCGKSLYIFVQFSDLLIYSSYETNNGNFRKNQ